MRILSIRYICFLIFVIYFTTSFGKKPSFLGKKATLINTIETKNCFISYVMINNQRYLVKQKKADNKQIAVVRDALAAFLVRGLKIAHQVDIISFKKSFPGKIREIWPATFHTIAPGDTVRKQPNTVYSKLRIKQLWSLAKNFDETGLTREIIAQMTWHRQLPIIIAIDLITGNSDRHCGNLCYDPTTDTFCAIDMDDTFNKNLCQIACRKLEIMLEDPNNVFTIQEINAFIQLRKTIRYILDHYKSSEVVKKLYYFARKAGFIPGNSIYTPSIVKKLSLYESMITQSWASAYKLINVLNKIIDQNIRNVLYVNSYLADAEAT